MPVPAVFLSSTFADFELERKSLIEMLPLIDVHVICTERAGNTGRPLAEILRAMIDRSDLVVLLIGSRAGQMWGRHETWTQMEVNYALGAGKRVLAYLRVPSAEGLEFFDRDDKKGRLVARFIRTVEARLGLVPRYTRGDCCRLTAMVIRDVGAFCRAHGAPREGHSEVK